MKWHSLTWKRRLLGFIPLMLLMMTACERKPDKPQVDIYKLQGELIAPIDQTESNGIAGTGLASDPPFSESNSLASTETEETNKTVSARRQRDKPGSYPKRMMELRAKFIQQGGEALTNLVGMADPPWRTNMTTPTVAGFLAVHFSQLAGYEFPDEPEVFTAPTGSPRDSILEHIPESVRTLDGQKCAVRGFLLPLLMDEGLTVQFLLMRDQTACCFGMVPRINEWIIVRMKGKGVEPQMDRPITVCGTLQVGEFREKGYLISLYQMDAEKVIGP